jgi:hypothetical protein
VEYTFKNLVSQILSYSFFSEFGKKKETFKKRGLKLSPFEILVLGTGVLLLGALN